MGAFIDLTGKKFFRLTVLEKADKRGNEWYWKCKCDCGNICTIAGTSLRAVCLYSDRRNLQEHGCEPRRGSHHS